MKKKPTIKQLTVYLAPDLAEKLEQESARQNRALAAMARQIIIGYFAERESKVVPHAS